MLSSRRHHGAPTKYSQIFSAGCFQLTKNTLVYTSPLKFSVHFKLPPHECYLDTLLHLLCTYGNKWLNESKEAVWDI